MSKKAKLEEEEKTSGKSMTDNLNLKMYEDLLLTRTNSSHLRSSRVQRKKMDEVYGPYKNVAVISEELKPIG